MRQIKWCLLTSGYGRSALTLLKLYKEGELGHNQVALIIYDREPSGAYRLASEMGVPALQIKKANYNKRQDFEDAIRLECVKFDIDYIFLLGFNYLLKFNLLKEYNKRIVNVHPSLLPAFKGKRAIQQAMEAGVKVTGLTTHIIDEKVDEGKILYQEAIKINSSMSFEEIDELYMNSAPSVLKKTMDIASALPN